MHASHLVSIGTAIAITLGVASASAQPHDAQGHHRRDGRRGHAGDLAERFDRIAGELQLDARTRAAVRQVLDQARPRAEELRTEKRQARRALRDLLGQAAPNEQAVLAMVRTLGQIRTDTELHRVQTLLRVRALLTPAQRAQLSTMRGRR